MKKLKILIIMIFLTLNCKAPSQTDNSFLLFESEPIEPYKLLIKAITWVESKQGLFVWNEEEEAAGEFQIRPIRLKDYNERVGSNYSMKDLFDYEISKKIFLYFADEIGPYDFERIAKKWNGSGPKTIEYWNKVKTYIN